MLIKKVKCFAILIVLFGLACARSEFVLNRQHAPRREMHDERNHQKDRTISTSTQSSEDEFWWGISTSAYQTEDSGPEAASQYKTDWDLHYEAGKLPDPRGHGAWSYSCVDRDIAALKALGAKHYRYGIEWARIEPSPGQYKQQAIDHYVSLARKLKAAGITPIITLWHFTFPAWLAGEEPENHGWLHPDSAERWRAFLKRVVPELAKEVQTFAPLNEPNAYALASLINQFPPGGTPRYGRYLRMLDAEAERFLEAAAIVRESRPDARIISVQNIIHWEPDPLDLFRFWYNKGLEYNYYHLDKVADACDWIGFNYYFSEIASPLALSWQSGRTGPDVSDMGWQIDPDGLEIEIANLSKRYGKPLLITENGIADKDDLKRPSYLLTHVLAVRRAIEAGYDVRGYFYWSLMDNYEWAHGYAQKFGLYAVDTENRSLVPKSSAEVYRALATGGVVEEPLETIDADSR